MDYICRAGEKAQHILHEKHPPYPGHIPRRQNTQRWCPVSCWSSQYIIINTHIKKCCNITRSGASATLCRGSLCRICGRYRRVGWREYTGFEDVYVLFPLFSARGACLVSSHLFVPVFSTDLQCFFIPSRKPIYVSTSVTLHIPRRINSSLNQSERRSPELNGKSRKRIGTLFVTS